MKNHAAIDVRGLALARAIVERIDADPDRTGFERARQVCARWHETRDSAAVREWLEILERPWEEVRRLLLDPSQEGQRRRQSSPFCGILSPQERWEIFRSFEAPRAGK